jgi:hypothetical protein
MRAGRAIRRPSRAPPALAIALGAVLLAACGGDDEPSEPTAPLTVPGTETAETTEAGGAGDVDTGARATTEEPAGEGGEPAEGGECVFRPPPERLAVSEIPIELSGVPCEQGMRLAEAAAVGQPAGANLSLSRDGFACEPSTREKGANVTYTCTKGSQEASFDVTWSGSG